MLYQENNYIIMESRQNTSTQLYGYTTLTDMYLCITKENPPNKDIIYIIHLQNIYNSYQVHILYCNTL